MSNLRRTLIPLAAGLAGSALIASIYFGIVSLAESPEHALDLFWQERTLVIPIILGFGVQTAVYVTLKKRLFVPVASTGPSGALTGMSGATSGLAMVACCVHHVTDVLPILGITAATAFLAQYRTAFMQLGLGTTLLGIVLMLFILLRERQKIRQHLVFAASNAAQE